MNLWHDSPTDGDTERRVLTVRQVNDAISDAIDRAFPRTVWVRGEVQRFPHDAASRKHLYFELQETGDTGAAEYAVSVALMGWDRQRYGLGRYVDGTDPDFQIANKMEVCLECKVDFYAKFGKISLKVMGVDKNFALGKLEARRRATLAFLRERGLLEMNRQVPLPDLPLRLGLITSPGSAAHHDFMEGIEGSGWAFTVLLQGAKMQGEQVQAQVIAALERLLEKGVDAIVLTRGGGSRADLSWFDQRDLAVAVAQCPVPVITAIGHEIDTSIADMVAHHSCKTPTAAAEFLIEIIDGQARRLDDAAERLLLLCRDRLMAAERRLEVARKLRSRVDLLLLETRLRLQRQAGDLLHGTTARLNGAGRGLARLGHRLESTGSRRLLHAAGRLRGAEPRLILAADRALKTARRELRNQERRLGREATRPCSPAATKLDTLAQKARLLDPARLLARGYSMTTDARGRLIKSRRDVAPGDTLLTRFADGRVRSLVQPGVGVGGPGKTPTKGRKRGSKQEESGQESLF